MQFGLVGMFCCAVFAPVAIFRGLEARKQFAQFPGRYSNEGHAMAGIVLGSITSFFVALMIIGAAASPKPSPAASSSTTRTPAVAGTTTPTAPATTRDRPARPAPPPKPSATDVQLRTLLGDYHNNEVRADALYKDKLVQVTGIVGDVKKDIMGNIYVTVGTGAAFEIPVVQAFFDDSNASKAAMLNKGDKVTVRGKVDGLMMNVLLKDCEFGP
jgi:hypothetical protein